jgi:hypothetical protein
MINLFEEKVDLLENEVNYEVEAIAPAVIVAVAAIVITCWPQPTR